MLATIWGYILPGIGVLLLIAAAAAYIYVPIVGRYLAAACLVVAAGTFAFTEGYRERGTLDQSAVLQADKVELQRQLDESKTVAADAAVAQKAAEDSAAATQKKVDAYVAQIKQTPPCGLTADDVDGLLGIK